MGLFELLIIVLVCFTVICLACFGLLIAIISGFCNRDAAFGKCACDLVEGAGKAPASVDEHSFEEDNIRNLKEKSERQKLQNFLNYDGSCMPEIG